MGQLALLRKKDANGFGIDFSTHLLYKNAPMSTLPFVSHMKHPEVAASGSPGRINVGTAVCVALCGEVYDSKTEKRQDAVRLTRHSSHDGCTLSIYQCF